MGKSSGGYKARDADKGHQGKHGDQSPCCLELRNDKGAESRTRFRARCRKPTRRGSNSRGEKNWREGEGRGVWTGVHSEIEENEARDDQSKMHLRPVIRQRGKHQQEHSECHPGESPHL